MKNVALVEAGIGGDYLTIAQDVVGLVPEPKTRWNVGSLVGALLGAVTPAMLLMVSDERVAARVALGAFEEIDFAAADMIGVFSPGEGTTRIREVFPLGSTFSVDPPDLSSFDADFVTAIAAPKVPTYSVASLVAAIISYFESLDTLPNYLIVVDQTNGYVRAFTKGEPFADDVFTAFIAGEESFDGIVGDLVANYELTPTTVTPDGETPPAWG